LRAFGVDIHAANGEERWTPLHVACAHGHVDVVRAFAYRRRKRYRRAGKYLRVFPPVDWNRADGRGRTPLHIACERNDAGVTHALLYVGQASVHVRNGHGSTPLHTACIHHADLRIVRALVEHGADVNARNDHQRTPLHYACACAPVHVVRFLVECGSSMHAQDVDQDTPLYCACTSGTIEVLSYLLDQGCAMDMYMLDTLLFRSARSRDEILPIVRRATAGGRLPRTDILLFAAIESGWDDIVEDYLEAGCCGDAIQEKNMLQHGYTDFYYSPVFYAMRAGRWAMATRIFSRHRVYPAGELLLHMALDELLCKVNHAVDVDDVVALIEQLVGDCPNINQTDKHGRSALELMSYVCSFRALSSRVKRWVDLAICEKGADITKTNGRGVSCIQRLYNAGCEEESVIRWMECARAVDAALVRTAAERGHLRMIAYLAAHGARANEIATAAAHGHAETVRYFVLRGCDVDECADGRTALFRASLRGDCDMARALLAAGARVEGARATTPLHVACLNGHLDMVRLLLEHGADVRRRTGDWREDTPLHLAATGAIARLLLSRGASVHARNASGSTPMHCLLDADKCDVLVQHGARVDETNDNGYTPLHMSCTLSTRDMMDRLLWYGAEPLVTCFVDDMSPIWAFLTCYANDIASHVRVETFDAAFINSWQMFFDVDVRQILSLSSVSADTHAAIEASAVFVMLHSDAEYRSEDDVLRVARDPRAAMFRAERPDEAVACMMRFASSDMKYVRAAMTRAFAVAPCVARAIVRQSRLHPSHDMFRWRWREQVWAAASLRTKLAVLAAGARWGGEEQAWWAMDMCVHDDDVLSGRDP
jgi:ankyrin repeat protein